jgi:outer membrane protein OmpA-like peptidoglycan-associated protein
MRAMRWSILVAIVLASGCSLFTVQQDPFPPLEIRADRGAPPPARVVLTESSIKITDKVQFEFGSAQLLEVSFPLLDDVAKVLVDNPQIESLQVEGHTDDVGGDSANKKLSQSRAESVKKYLTSKGVAAKRLVAKGFGEEKPLVDNTTPENRDANRRVEFNILKQGPKKTVVQDE